VGTATANIEICYINYKSNKYSSIVWIICWICSMC